MARTPGAEQDGTELDCPYLSAQQSKKHLLTRTQLDHCLVHSSFTPTLAAQPDPKAQQNHPNSHSKCTNPTSRKLPAQGTVRKVITHRLRPSERSQLGFSTYTVRAALKPLPVFLPSRSSVAAPFPQGSRAGGSTGPEPVSAKLKTAEKSRRSPPCPSGDFSPSSQTKAIFFPEQNQVQPTLFITGKHKRGTSVTSALSAAGGSPPEGLGRYLGAKPHCSHSVTLVFGG